MAKLRKNVLLTTMIVFLMLILNVVAAASQYNNVNGRTPEYQVKKNYIDPALIDAGQLNHESGKKLPVIITFNAKTFEQDYNAFMDQYNGSKFILKYKFSIIPGISGYIDNDTLQELKSSSISMAIHENSNLSIQLRLKSSSTTPSKITASQTTNWWHDIIGLNNSTVSSLNGSGIKVGILDTGIGYESSSGPAIHLDLANKVVESINFAYGVPAWDVYDEFGHGTHVAGIIAGSGAASNGEYAGIAPDVSLYNLKVLNSTGSGNEDDIIYAIQWSVNNGLDIINLSLGGGTADPNDPESMAVQNATNHGVLVVMAEGNDGPEYFTGGSPAAAYGGIAVGAMNNQMQVSDFSSRGPSLASIFEPDVVAPGEGIISTLGANSFIEKYYGYYGLTIPSNVSSGNDYVALDGTSMATPMVVGAAALILQKFPGLVPAKLKASLMESAKDLGYDPCTQGMGLINVPGAIAFLEKVQANTSLVRVYPKMAPYAPYDLVNFPGSKEEILLKVEYKVPATPQNVHFEYTGNLTGINITANPSTLVLSNSGEKILNFTITSAFNATPGNYSISIKLMGASTMFDHVALNFTMQAPRLKIYLDSFHSVEDQYPWTFPLSRIAMDYYPMIKNLSKSGIQVVTYMDYWSPGYNSTLAKGLLDYSWLQNFDAVIIPPLVTGLFQSEINALVRYHEHGGQIVVLGSRYQEFSYSTANTLLVALGMGVQFSPINTENLTGEEFDNAFLDVPVTNLNKTNFLNQGIKTITWSSGSELERSNLDVPIVASDASGNTLITMLPEIAGQGSILVSGSESIIPMFYNSPGSANNARFVKNLIDYYQGFSDIRINGYISKNMVFNDTSVSVFFQAFNKTSGSYYVLNSTNARCTLFNDTGIISTITLNTATGTWFGNNSLALSKLANMSAPYSILFNFTRAGKSYYFTLAFSKFGDGGRAALVTLSNTIPSRGTSLYVYFSLAVNVTMLISGIPLETFASRQPYTMDQTISNNNFASISLPYTMPAGQYFIELMSTSTNGSYPYPMLQRTSFTLENNDPVIDEYLSSIAGTDFASTDLGNGYVRLVSVKTEQGINIIVTGSDQETQKQALSAYVVFYPTCIINNSEQLMPYGLNLIMQNLVYDSSSKQFSGSITIPSSVTFTVGGKTISRQFATSSDYSGVLIVVLRDDDGGYGVFYLFLTISNQFNIYWVIIPLVIAVPVVLVMVFFLVRRRRRNYGSQPMNRSYYGDSGPGYYGSGGGPGFYVNNPGLGKGRQMKRALNFCPYCGKPANPSVKFCPYCGNEINFS